MRIDLPIPVYFNNEVFCTAIDIKKPNAGCIADTEKMFDSGDQYGAVAFFISSCTESIETSNGTVSDIGVIKNTVRNMPYRTAEYAFIQIMLLRHSDDGVEGVYKCPRCGEKLICEAKKDRLTGEMLYDTRDFIRNLKVTSVFGLSNICCELEEPVEIKTTEGDVLVRIESLVMRHPTLADSISGSRKADKTDKLRSQFAIYTEALVDINGVAVDSQWKNRYGSLLFDRLNPEGDLLNLTNKVNEFGMEKRVLRTCKECGKEWRSIVNTSNFFDSEALHM